jgi:hypothetical protein
LALTSGIAVHLVAYNRWVAIDRPKDERPFVTVLYQLEPDVEAPEFIDVLVRSTLAERRPVNSA